MRKLLLLALLLGACAPPQVPLVPVEFAPAYAVVFSDYGSSSIGLLDGNLAAMAPDWVTSGTRTPILVTAVSGDAILPTEGLGGGLLSWLNREADVFTVVDPRAPDSLAQHDVQRGPATGNVANPHDALRLPDGRVLLSRHDPDPELLGTSLERGNDLFVLDLATEEAQRIPLGCDGEDGIYARPDQLAPLQVGERDIVLVALARLGERFASFGEGALTTIDARTFEVLDCTPMGGAANCQYVRAVPDAPGHAVVLCTGDPMRPESIRRNNASVIEVSVDAMGAITLGARLDGRTLAENSVPTAYPLPLGGGLALAISDGRGEDGRRPDRLLRLDLMAGTVEVLAESDSFTLGSGTYDGPGTSLLIPDGASNELIVYSIPEGRITRRIAVPTATGLPLRQISRL